MDYTQLFRGISRKMTAEFQDITSQISHMGDRGGNREEVIHEFLRKHLPAKYSIGSGQAISVDQQISKQLDTVIFAHSSCPLWYNERTQIFPVESVCSVVEIKSTLNTAVLEECVENIRSIRKLPKLAGVRPLGGGVAINADNPGTYGCVFAYSSTVSLETLRDNLNLMNKQIPPHERICLLCVLDKGVFINIDPSDENKTVSLPNENSIVASITTEEDALFLFFLYLSAYLNNIEVIPPDLFAYSQHIISQFKWESRFV